MAVVVDPVRVWLIFPKLLVAAAYLTFGTIIYRKRDYVLNKVFFAAFVSWAVYNGLDAFSNTFAASSVTWFRACSIMWTIQMFALYAYAFLIWQAARIIKESEWGLNNRLVVTVFVVFMVLAGVLAWTAPLQVLDEAGTPIPPGDLPPAGAFQVTEVFNAWTVLLSLVPFVAYFLAAYHILGVLRKVDDRARKRRMIFILVGIMLVPLGALYFMFRSLFFPVYSLGSSLVGQAFFLGAPVFIYLSQRHPDDAPAET